MTIMSVAKKVLPAVTGVITLIFSPPIPGWSTVKDNIESDNLDKALQSGIAGVSGVQIGGIGGQGETYIAAGSVLNPFKFSHAPVTKVVLWTRVVLEVADAVQGSVKGFISDIMKG